MAEPNFGIYQAIVTDNSDFYSTGRIKVRVQNFYNGKLNWDLSQGYNAKEFPKDILEDISALIYTPIGGGSGHGLFALPQVNSVGVVQYLNGNINKPMWMGSFFNPTIDPDTGKVLKVNVPNDNPQQEGSGSDGIIKGPTDAKAKKNIDGPDGSVIFRMKSTKAPGADEDPKNMDFNEQRTENLIVFNEEKINFTHFSKWDDSTDQSKLKQWEEIELGTQKEYDINGNVIEEYPEINIKVSEEKSGGTLKTLSVKINNDKVSLEVIDGDIVTDLGINSAGVEIVSYNSKSKSSTSFEQTPERITLAGKDASVVIDQDEVILSSEKKVRISAKKLILGNNGGHLMGVNNLGEPIETRDGYTMFSTSIEV